MVLSLRSYPAMTSLLALLVILIHTWALPAESTPQTSLVEAGANGSTYSAALDGDNECAADHAKPLALDEGRCMLSALQHRALSTDSVFTASSVSTKHHAIGGAERLSITYNATGLPDDLRRKGPPSTPLGYDGMTWPTMVVEGKEPTHVFAIGDWGGMDGGFMPSEDSRFRVMAYHGGMEPGPHVFPRSRWNKDHSAMICSHKQFVACFNKEACHPGCGFTEGVDTQPQQLVANAFNGRARLKQPKYVLNVGDNFYWGGVEKTCGTTPMSELSFEAEHQFNTIFNSMYPGDVPWVSALGNHDYGGWRFDNAWDQQIAYTWKNPRWVMPASYYKQTVSYPDQEFSLDIFVLDSNYPDALEPHKLQGHNMCSHDHNPVGATCASAGGPASIEDCPGWFKRRWEVQQQWLMEKLEESDADWQVVSTHFPCGTDAGWYKKLHANLGLDLLVTGHRHDQELWEPDRLGGLTCFVTGGGGGITSEASPNPMQKNEWYGEAQYGFYDLTITKEKIFIESINYDGKVLVAATVYPKAFGADPEPTSVNASELVPAPANASQPKAASTNTSDLVPGPAEASHPLPAPVHPSKPKPTSDDFSQATR